jgi:hypothetical protein
MLNACKYNSNIIVGMTATLTASLGSKLFVHVVCRIINGSKTRTALSCVSEGCCLYRSMPTSKARPCCSVMPCSKHVATAQPSQYSYMLMQVLTITTSCSYKETRNADYSCLNHAKLAYHFFLPPRLPFAGAVELTLCARDRAGLDALLPRSSLTALTFLFCGKSALPSLS